MKYNEDKILKECLDYIKSSYGQHYAQVKEGVQVQDLLRSCGIIKIFAKQMQLNILQGLVKRMVEIGLTY